MIAKDEKITIHQNRTESTWAGILENGKLTLFNVHNTTIRKEFDISTPVLADAKQRIAVFVFDCPDSISLHGYDFSHRLTRSYNPSNSPVVNYSKMRQLLKAVSKINSDLSGLTAARLIDVRKGVFLLSRKLNSVNSYKTSDGASVVSFQEARISDWNKSQELQMGRIS